eukprot:g977.t1
MHRTCHARIQAKEVNFTKTKQHDVSGRPCEENVHDYWWPSGDQDLYDLPTHQAPSVEVPSCSVTPRRQECQVNATGVVKVQPRPALPGPMSWMTLLWPFRRNMQDTHPLAHLPSDCCAPLETPEEKSCGGGDSADAEPKTMQHLCTKGSPMRSGQRCQQIEAGDYGCCPEEHVKGDDAAQSSMHCVALFRAWHPEQKLLELQYEKKAGIFACESFGLYSSQEVELFPGVVSRRVHSAMMCEIGGMFITALNLGIFLAFYRQVILEAEFLKSAWVIKVDPDTVWSPQRLRPILHSQRWGLDGDGIYLNNCHDGLHGPIDARPHTGVRATGRFRRRKRAAPWAERRGEGPPTASEEVFSTRAFLALGHNAKKCATAMDGQECVDNCEGVWNQIKVCNGPCTEWWGEEPWKTREGIRSRVCVFSSQMLESKAKRVFVKTLLQEAHCKPHVPDWRSCNDPHVVAFHPFKDPADMERCLEAVEQHEVPKQTAGDSCFVHLKKPLEAPPFSAAEEAELWRLFEANVNVNGLGAVIASPGACPAQVDCCGIMDPMPYGFHWTRDASLSLLTLLERVERSTRHNDEPVSMAPSLRGWRTSDSTLPELRSDVEKTIVAYAAWVARMHGRTRLAGNLESVQSAAEAWALRARLLMRAAEIFPHLVNETLWPLAQKDLDWLVEHHSMESCDLWEETRDREEFLTNCPAMNAGKDCVKYNKTLDGVLILTLIHGRPMVPTEHLQLPKQLSLVFCESYPINQEDTAAEVPGVLMGRYAKDRYGHQKEGNPWVLITASLANLLYKACSGGDGAAGAAWAKVFRDPGFGASAADFVAAGDAVLLRLRRHMADGMHLFDARRDADGGTEWAATETVLVLVPTRRSAEKAYMTSSALRKWSLRTLLVHEEGGPLASSAQQALLRRGANLVICTARRAKALLQQGLSFDEPGASAVSGRAPLRMAVRCLVLDEAEELFATYPEELQGVVRVVLCEAAPPLQDLLVQRFLRDPVLIDSGAQPSVALHAEHLCCELPSSQSKRARMLAFLLNQQLGRDVAPMNGATTPADRASQEPGPRARMPAPKALVLARRGEIAQLAAHAMLRQKVLALQVHG